MKVIKITALFLIISLIYIFFADRVAHMFITEDHHMQIAHDVIGLIYAFFTSVTIFILVSREIKKHKQIAIQLKERNEHFEKIFNNAPTGIAMADMEGNFASCNRAFLDMLGYPEEELSTKQFPDILWKEDLEENMQLTAQMKSGDMKYFELESRYIHKDGHPLWSHKYVTLLPGKTGKPETVLALVTDITERKLNEQQRSEQQILLETMFNAISDGMVITNTNREITHANNGMKYTFGYKPEELIGKSTEILYADKKKFADAGNKVFGQYVQKPDSFYLTSYKDKTGKIFTGETFGAKLYNSEGTWIGNLGIMRDISERMEFIQELKRSNEELMAAEEEIRATNQELKKVMNSVIHTEEEERKRISQELHDGIGPLLSTVKLYYQTYIRTDKPEIREKINTQLLDTLNEAIQQISDISNNLSPHILNDFGLKAAIGRVLQRVCGVAAISYKYDYQAEAALSDEYKITLYRVAVELINNTVKHASAANIELLVSNNKDRVRLDFYNDGEKFDYEVLRSKKHGLGLFNIESRINSLGGTLVFAAAKYMASCAKYLESQNEAMTRELRSGGTDETRLKKITLINEIIDLGNEARINNFKAQATRDRDLFEDAMGRFDGINALLDEIEKYTREQKDLQALALIRESGAVYSSAMSSYLGDWEKRDELATLRDEAGRELIAAAISTADAGIAGTQDIADATISLLRASSVTMVTGLFLAIIIGIVFAVFLTKSITTPVIKGVKFAKQLSEGDLTATIDVDQGDEIGQLASALSNMGEKLRSIVNEIMDGSNNIASASQQM